MSEKTERIEILLEGLKSFLFTPAGEVKLHRMTTYDNLGFKEAHRLAEVQSKEEEWETKEQNEDGVDRVFYATYPAKWGHKWQYGWFTGSFDLAPCLKGNRIELLPDVGGEMLIEVNGKLAGSRDLRHTGITLTSCSLGNEHYEIMIESYSGHGPRFEHAGPAFYDRDTVPEAPEYQVSTGKCIYGVWDEIVYSFYMDAETLYQLYKCSEKTSLRAENILDALQKAARCIDFENGHEALVDSIKETQPLLKKELACKNGSSPADFSIFGQSHLDLAWKWTLEETRRKTARTYSTQLALLDEYPDYIFFGCSPFILETIRVDYPELFERIKDRVKKGRIVVDGGMYVEPDTNMTAGEALIRQILEAKRWYKTYLDTDTEMVWLPDCFGFSGQLPQIMKKTGIRYFSTQKLFRAPEEAEAFPYNDFYWEGIDGTRIPVHMFKKNNANLSVAQLYDRWNKDRVQHEHISEMLFPFGFGDGGGGATRDMLETAERAGDLEGLPRTHWEDPVSFMRRLEKRLDDQHEKYGEGPDGVNVYRGELYLPWHRGTYTSQARLKAGNRAAERSLHDAEMWCAICTYLGLEKDEDLTGQIRELWKKLMFLEFHDVLPGSSIERVNDEALDEFRYIIRRTEELKTLAQRKICSDDDAVFNSLSFERKVSGGRFSLPSCGYGHLTAEILSETKGAFAEISCTETDGKITMDNGILRAVVDEGGRILSLRYRGREYLSAPANAFRLYKDINTSFDAWELSPVYLNGEIKGAFDNVRLTGFGTDTDGFVPKAYAEISGDFSGSEIKQRICLALGAEQIEFETEVDWHETHKLLKVDFPTVIRADGVRCEIQYGYVTRPNSRSKKSDRDRFECCMLRYAALTEDDMGLLLLNDSKHGCSAQGSTLSMSCLKAPKIPDMHADMGEHRFSYALKPYVGAFTDSKAAKTAAEFGHTVEVSEKVMAAAGNNRSQKSFFELSEGNVLIDWIKSAEDGSGDLILRLYESMNSHETVKLKVNAEHSALLTCDMDERGQEKICPDEEGQAMLAFKPFEVRTVRVCH